MFTCKISRATVLTAATTRTGVGIKNLFPGKFFQFGYTEGFLIFNITNRLYISGWFQGCKEVIGRCRNYVQKPRIRNVRDKTKNYKSMRPPHNLVKSQSCGCFDAGKCIGGDAPADESDPFPGSLLISYTNSQGTDEKPCHDDAQNEEQGDRVIGSIVRFSLISQTLRFDYVSAQHCHKHPDQHTKTECLHQESETQIKIAAIKRPTQ